jgi:SAM-dependent methyltransferase
LVKTTFHQMPGLFERLQQPRAAFLDAGAGVGGAAIALARCFPKLHIIGLEPNPAALQLAQRNVDAAELAERIELRQQRVEKLRLREAFDAGHMAQAFFSDEALERGLKNVHAALRPGGWLLTTTVSAEGPGLAAALSRLQNELWGGGARLPDELVRRLTEAGYVSVAVMDGHANVHPVIGRRPRSD